MKPESLATRIYSGRTWMASFTSIWQVYGDYAVPFLGNRLYRNENLLVYASYDTNGQIIYTSCNMILLKHYQKWVAAF